MSVLDRRQVLKLEAAAMAAAAGGIAMPALAVATVGSYGLAVWIYQMAAGPPGPPSR